MDNFVKQQKLLDSLELSFKRKVIREKNRFIRQQAEKLYSSRRISDEDYAEHIKNMREIFIMQTNIIIRTFFIETENQIKLAGANIDLEKKFTAWDFFASQWIAERAGAMAQQTSSTTRSDIQSSLDDALAQEEGVNERDFTRRILETQGFSRFRAEVIAATETHAAAMFASQKTAEQISSETGLELLKVWNAVEDERTRFSHSAANGQKVGMNAKFTVNGEKLERPGDPRGSAGNVIRCRCVLTYEPKDGNRGLV